MLLHNVILVCVSVCVCVCVKFGMIRNQQLTRTVKVNHLKQELSIGP